jgi:hypothetical protein
LQFHLRPERILLSNRQSTLLRLFVERDTLPARQVEAIDGRTIKSFEDRKWIRKHGASYSITRKGLSIHELTKFTDITKRHSEITMAQIFRRARLALVERGHKAAVA